MTVTNRTAAPSFANALTARARPSYYQDVLGYYLFGVDDASSRRNLIGTGDLIPFVSQGPYSFTANTATMGGARGYQTPFQVTPYACTAIVVCDSDTRNPDGTGGQMTFDFSPFGIPTSQTNFAIRFSGNGCALASISGLNFASRDPAGISPIFQPPGGIQRFQCITERANGADCYLEDYRGLCDWSVTSSSPPAAPATVVDIGVVTGSGYSRMSAALFLNRWCSAAEMQRLYEDLRRDLAARGNI